MIHTVPTAFMNAMGTDGSRLGYSDAGQVDYLDLDVKKPVFGVSDKVNLKPVCSATEDDYNI